MRQEEMPHESGDLRPPGAGPVLPVALSVAHCADLNGPADATWAVRLKRTTPENKWEEVMSMDEESTSCYGLLEAERCHLLVGRPGRYALVGGPLSQAAAKRLRLAVFGSPDLSNPLGYNLRVYCVDDTPHALQCAFSLERLGPQPKPPQLSCKISVLQVKGREQILQVYTPAAESEKGLIPLFPLSHCPLTSESGSTAFKIPPSIHQRICATFDSANSKGKD
ncbi:unnamed protein product [Gadus morhua 'NCC']